MQNQNLMNAKHFEQLVSSTNYRMKKLKVSSDKMLVKQGFITKICIQSLFP